MPAPASKVPRFEIWWVNLPVQEGHAQSGKRPAVIAADEPDNRFTIVLPVTTTLDRLRFKGAMRVEPDASNCLRDSSVVMAFQIRYLDRNRLAERIGHLNDSDSAILDGLLADLLGFEA